MVVQSLLTGHRRNGKILFWLFLNKNTNFSKMEPYLLWQLLLGLLLQLYAPLHQQVAPHESWHMEQLGNYPAQQNAQWLVVGHSLNLIPDVIQHHLCTRIFLSGTAYYSWLCAFVVLMIWILSELSLLFHNILWFMVNQSHCYVVLFGS